ncbi:hypothetical protein CF95_gp225 [Erwinia phage PhiEaH1]|uniref:Uncharacterized protein n=1 Tax=Erwinia phage PhiEaH1 TaxID=1401669 RepID=W8CZH0_9CAUD|nr:hypothetical protein CF95_gp225 [Erwinia phage PhiEaH1]AGX01947.1 hypothetical protein [Erwinia phage PhiEaH1]
MSAIGLVRAQRTVAVVQRVFTNAHEHTAQFRRRLVNQQTRSWDDATDVGQNRRHAFFCITVVGFTLNVVASLVKVLVRFFALSEFTLVTFDDVSHLDDCIADADNLLGGRGINADRRIINVFRQYAGHSRFTTGQGISSAFDFVCCASSASACRCEAHEDSLVTRHLLGTTQSQTFADFAEASGFRIRNVFAEQLSIRVQVSRRSHQVVTQRRQGRFVAELSSFDSFQDVVRNFDGLRLYGFEQLTSGVSSSAQRSGQTLCTRELTVDAQHFVRCNNFDFLLFGHRRGFLSAFTDRLCVGFQTRSRSPGLFPPGFQLGAHFLEPGFQLLPPVFDGSFQAFNRYASRLRRTARVRERFNRYRHRIFDTVYAVQDVKQTSRLNGDTTVFLGFFQDFDDFRISLSHCFSQHFAFRLNFVQLCFDFIHFFQGSTGVQFNLGSLCLFLVDGATVVFNRRCAKCAS